MVVCNFFPSNGNFSGVETIRQIVVDTERIHRCCQMSEASRRSSSPASPGSGARPESSGCRGFLRRPKTLRKMSGDMMWIWKRLEKHRNIYSRFNNAHFRFVQRWSIPGYGNGSAHGKPGWTKISTRMLVTAFHSDPSTISSSKAWHLHKFSYKRYKKQFERS